MSLASLESTRNSFDYAKNNTQGLVKLYKETAEIAEHMSRDLATTDRRAEKAYPVGAHCFLLVDPPRKAR
jgi:hypothetical protein